MQCTWESDRWNYFQWSVRFASASLNLNDKCIQYLVGVGGELTYMPIPVYTRGESY